MWDATWHRAKVISSGLSPNLLISSGIYAPPAPAPTLQPAVQHSPEGSVGPQNNPTTSATQPEPVPGNGPSSSQPEGSEAVAKPVGCPTEGKVDGCTPSHACEENGFISEECNARDGSGAGAAADAVTTYFAQPPAMPTSRLDASAAELASPPDAPPGIHAYFENPPAPPSDLGSHTLQTAPHPSALGDGLVPSAVADDSMALPVVAPPSGTPATRTSEQGSSRGDAAGTGEPFSGSSMVASAAGLDPGLVSSFGPTQAEPEQSTEMAGALAAVPAAEAAVGAPDTNPVHEQGVPGHASTIEQTGSKQGQSTERREAIVGGEPQQADWGTGGCKQS